MRASECHDTARPTGIKLKHRLDARDDINSLWRLLRRTKSAEQRHNVRNDRKRMTTMWIPRRKIKNIGRQRGVGEGAAEAGRQNGPESLNVMSNLRPIR
jgi:hypothetical protein